MKKSKIIKMLAKNLTKQSRQLLDERRQEREIQLGRELDDSDHARERADRLLDSMTKFMPGIVAWLSGSGGHVCPTDPTGGDPKDATDLWISILDSLSVGQVDHLSAILSQDQKERLAMILVGATRASTTDAPHAAPDPNGIDAARDPAHI